MPRGIAPALGSRGLPRCTSPLCAQPPRAFQMLKIFREGGNWEEPGGKVIEALMVGSRVQDKTLEQKGSAGSFSFWFFPRMSSTKPSTAFMHAYPCACFFPQKVFVARRSWGDQSNKSRTHKYLGGTASANPPCGWQTGWEGGIWTDAALLFHLRAGHAGQHMAWKPRREKHKGV